MEVGTQSMRRWRCLVPLVIAAGVVLAAGLRAGDGAAGWQLGLQPVVELRLHGSTPSLAWSPDGRRLAVNAAFGVYSPQQLRKVHAEELGVHVVDVYSKRRFKLAFQTALHPFWLGKRMVGWVNDYYTGERGGVFLAAARPGAAPKPVPGIKSAHRAHPTPDGGLLVYTRGGWKRLDADSGELGYIDLGGDSGPQPGSWDTPAEHIVPQCHQQAGRVTAGLDAAGRVLLRLGGRTYRLAGPKAWIFRHRYVDQRWTGPVAPCLSPDGRHLAYLARTEKPQAYTLRVLRVPGAAQARSRARRLSAGAAAAGGQPQAGDSGALGRRGHGGSGGRGLAGLQPQGGGEPLTAFVQPQARLRLHGSTPSLAWSPDSRRVVVNAAYSYYGHDEAIARHRDSLGIWVLGTGGERMHVFGGQGYHPFWLGKDNVGWGHSRYEDGEPGLYTAPARPQAPVRRIGRLEGIHRTLLARDGRVLAYVGFPEYERWSLIDPDTGAVEPIGELREVSSWKTPDKYARSQCRQQVGGARLIGVAEHGFVLQRAGQRWGLSPQGLFQFSGRSGQSGPVRACLSPDGRWVALLSGPPQGAGGYAAELRIAAVPR